MRQLNHENLCDITNAVVTEYDHSDVLYQGIFMYLCQYGDLDKSMNDMVSQLLQKCQDALNRQKKAGKNSESDLSKMTSSQSQSTVEPNGDHDISHFDLSQKNSLQNSDNQLIISNVNELESQSDLILAIDDPKNTQSLDETDTITKDVKLSNPVRMKPVITADWNKISDDVWSQVTSYLDLRSIIFSFLPLTYRHFIIAMELNQTPQISFENSPKLESALNKNPPKFLHTCNKIKKLYFSNLVNKFVNVDWSRWEKTIETLEIDYGMCFVSRYI